MSEVMPYKEENMSHYEGKEEEEGQISITCRLQDTNNFFGTAQNKRPPKLGQIGRSKRVVIEDDSTENVPKNAMEKAPDDV
ncbi:calcium/calmodulin-dependent protein kinase II inhibitor 1b [Osmerus eperlanus]|uniref:calcium/calmodulin-dependent protein kinase II inhibitor 1b n=1 Tax=Osmerus eperlanus TaxID=29151 RepID=UPI002E155B3C